MAQILTLEYPSEEAVRWITDTLISADLKVAISFDLRAARATHVECSCPHHGTAACDCQMVVLLVYGADVYPASLVVHGRDGRTYVSLVSSPGQRPPRELAVRLPSALGAAASSM